MFSMTSTSPQFGQPAVPMLSPSIQNAGQIPCPNGILIRASNRPKVWVNLFLVSNLPEVKLRGIPSEPVNDSLSALITSEPPSRYELSTRFVYVSSSLLPHPLPPISKDHLLESGPEPSGPLNSSLQARLHTLGSAVVGEREYERL